MNRAPLHDWHRHHPTAHRIAVHLLTCRDVLNLRSRRLVRDVRDRFGVGDSTARIAIELARRAA